MRFQDNMEANMRDRFGAKSIFLGNCAYDVSQFTGGSVCGVNKAVLIAGSIAHNLAGGLQHGAGPTSFFSHQTSTDVCWLCAILLSIQRATSSIQTSQPFVQTGQFSEECTAVQEEDNNLG
jgi:hypothetical protein